jgi:hypothetical protein
MFIGQRTYPKIRPDVIILSTKYNKATELDLYKATRVAQYVYGCKETHQLILAPKSLKLVCSADPSYESMQMGRVTVVELWVLSQIHAAILYLYHASNL